MNKRILVLDNLIDNANYLSGIREIFKDLGLTDVVFRDIREFRRLVGKTPDVILQAADDYDITDKVAQCIIDSEKPIDLIGYYGPSTFSNLSQVHNNFWKKTRKIKDSKVKLIGTPYTENGWKEALSKYL